MVVPGIVVEITDAATGAWIAGGARGAVRDGSYVDSLAPHHFRGDNTMKTRQAAGDRAGVYEVAVVHEGYRDWSRAGVRVEKAVCSVTTVSLQAAMEPRAP
jgi:hypothetical protein